MKYLDSKTKVDHTWSTLLDNLIKADRVELSELLLSRSKIKIPEKRIITNVNSFDVCMAEYDMMIERCIKYGINLSQILTTDDEYNKMIIFSFNWEKGIILYNRYQKIKNIFNDFKKIIPNRYSKDKIKSIKAKYLGDVIYVDIQFIGKEQFKPFQIIINHDDLILKDIISDYLNLKDLEIDLNYYTEDFISSYNQSLTKDNSHISEMYKKSEIVKEQLYSSILSAVKDENNEITEITIEMKNYKIIANVICKDNPSAVEIDTGITMDDVKTIFSPVEEFFIFFEHEARIIKHVFNSTLKKESEAVSNLRERIINLTSPFHYHPNKYVKNTEIIIGDDNKHYSLRINFIDGRISDLESTISMGEINEAFDNDENKIKTFLKEVTENATKRLNGSIISSVTQREDKVSFILENGVSVQSILKESQKDNKVVKYIRFSHNLKHGFCDVHICFTDNTMLTIEEVKLNRNISKLNNEQIHKLFDEALDNLKEEVNFKDPKKTKITDLLGNKLCELSGKLLKYFGLPDNSTITTIDIGYENENIFAPSLSSFSFTTRHFVAYTDLKTSSKISEKFAYAPLDQNFYDSILKFDILCKLKCKFNPQYTVEDIERIVKDEISEKVKPLIDTMNSIFMGISEIKLNINGEKAIDVRIDISIDEHFTKTIYIDNDIEYLIYRYLIIDDIFLKDLNNCIKKLK